MFRAQVFGMNSQYERFLSAPICIDVNGVEMSIMSALARAGINPLNEAAALAHLPRGIAADHLLGLLSSLPNVPSKHATYENAARLIGLLYQNAEINQNQLPPGVEDTIRDEVSAAFMYLRMLLVIAILIIMFQLSLSRFTPGVTRVPNFHPTAFITRVFLP